MQTFDGVVVDAPFLQAGNVGPMRVSRGQLAAIAAQGPVPVYDCMASTVLTNGDRPAPVGIVEQWRLEGDLLHAVMRLDQSTSDRIAALRAPGAVIRFAAIPTLLQGRDASGNDTVRAVSAALGIAPTVPCKL